MSCGDSCSRLLCLPRDALWKQSSYGALDSDLSFLRGEGGEGRSPGADLPLVCSAARILVGE